MYKQQTKLKTLIQNHKSQCSGREELYAIFYLEEKKKERKIKG
jgi:hypothetical protein